MSLKWTVGRYHRDNNGRYYMYVGRDGNKRKFLKLAQEEDRYNFAVDLSPNQKYALLSRLNRIFPVPAQNKGFWYYAFRC